MKYGIQLYGLRDITSKDMEGALRAVSEIGYSYVEFAGFFGHSSKEIVDMLTKYNLEVSGTHTGWQELLPENYTETVKYHKEIGNKNIIIPGADLSTKEKLDEFIDFINETAPKLKQDGIELHYHNHSREFITTDYGVMTHSELEKRTGIKFEIDTYWAFHAGKDPIEVLNRLRDRIDVIHIKDGMADGSGKPLGQGEAPVKKVYECAKTFGMLMVVESETLTPDGATEARVCFEHLKKLESGEA